VIRMRRTEIIYKEVRYDENDQVSSKPIVSSLEKKQIQQ
jgi:hypothetical protein